MPIRAVFFDVDDTLVDIATASRQALTHALGAGLDFELWYGLPHYDRFVSGELSFQAMLDLRMADYLNAIGRNADSAVDLEATRMGYLTENYVLFDDVLACLDELSAAGLMLGVITNNDGRLQRAKLARVGLDGRFHALAISGELGFGKPDSRIFAHACKQLGVRPDEAVHVGDRLDIDARAAADCGLGGVWLNRSGALPAPDVGISEILSLADLTPGWFSEQLTPSGDSISGG